MRKLRHAPEGWNPGLTRVQSVGTKDDIWPGWHGTFVRNSYPLPGHTPAGRLGVLVRFDGERDLIDVDPADLEVICDRDPFAAVGHKLPTRFAPGATGAPYDYPGEAGTWFPVIYYPAGVVEEEEGPIWLVEPYPAERADRSDGLDPVDSAGVAVVRCDAAPRPRGTDLDGDWIIPERSLERDCAYDAYVTNPRDLLAAWVEAYAIAAALNTGLPAPLSADHPEDIEVLLAAERRSLHEDVDALLVAESRITRGADNTSAGTSGAVWSPIGGKDDEHRLVQASQLARLRDSFRPTIAAVKVTSTQTLYGLTPDGVTALDAIRKIGFEHGGPRCRECGCTQWRACEGGCSWVNLGGPGPLCSACPDTPRR